MAIKVILLIVFFTIFIGIGLYCRRNSTDVNGSDTNGTGNDSGTAESENEQVGLFTATTLGATSQDGSASGGEQVTQEKSYEYNAGLYSERVNNGKAYAGVYVTDALEQNAPDSGSAVRRQRG